MRRPTVRSWAVLAGILLAAGVAHTAPTVYFEPAQAQVEEGQPFSLGIRVDAGTDTLTCFLVEFSFDEDVIDLVLAEEGTLLAESGFPTMFDWDPITPGTHSCNDVTLGYDSFVLCPGELVGLDFVAHAVGSTDLVFSAVDLRDIRRECILPVSTAGGSVTVIQGTGMTEEGLTDRPQLRCFPNPFRSGMTIALSDEATLSRARALVFDVGGRVVASPNVRAAQGGVVEWLWDGRGEDGRKLPDGVYFVMVGVGDERLTRRVTLMR